MTILLIVGVALVVFGGLLLLKFPDRPGGRVALGKVEVSSKGAGLPLVVIGVVCVVLGVRGGGADDNGAGAVTPTPTATPTQTATRTPIMTPTPAAAPAASPGQYPAESPTAGGPRVGRQVPPECGPDPQGENFSAVTVTLQLDEADRTIPTGGRVPNDLRFWLFDGSDLLGVVDLKPRPTGDGAGALFRVAAARDGDCRPASFTNKVGHPGGPSVLLNWHTGRLLTEGGAAYEVRLGYEPAEGIKVQSFIKTQ